VNTTKAKDKIYVGDLNFLPEACTEEHFKKDIEIVEITLREEVVYDVDLQIPEKVKLAKMLDDMGVPVIQMHSQKAGAIMKACRDAGVRAKFEVLSRPYNPYGFKDWKAEIMEAIQGGADRIRPSITTPRKWMMGDPSMSLKNIADRTLEDVKFALDNGAKEVTIGFTDSPRMDLNYLVEIGARAVELGATTMVINDTVGVAKPALMKHMVRTLAKGTGGKIRVHCHNDFGLATANTLAALEAGADGAETVINGADPARSGIAPLAEVVMALLCLYNKDIGIDTTKLTDSAFYFADVTGIPVAEQKPVVADRNWMYKRDHIMRTITKDESIQFPFSPSLVGQKFQIGLGRGSGAVGIREKLASLGIEMLEDRIPDIVAAVNAEAMQRKRRLSDDEFRALVIRLKK
jgi:2-isopropylmalate synthase